MSSKKDEINIGGSAFWIILILIALVGLSYLMIWSFHNDSIKGIVVSVIFVTLILSGIILSRFKIFDLASWGDNAISFTIGFAVWGGMGAIFGAQSILSVGTNNLLATIASELPVLMDTVLNVFIIPISEEIFWMIGIPFTIISLMNIIGKKFEICKNLFVQLFVVVAISATTFAIFHVGKFFIAFIIAAMIFRTIMLVAVFGDYNWDIIKGVNLVAGFSVGAHIANNLFDKTEGFTKTMIVLSTSIPVLIMVLAFFSIIFGSAIYRIYLYASGKAKSLGDS